MRWQRLARHRLSFDTVVGNTPVLSTASQFPIRKSAPTCKWTRIGFAEIRQAATQHWAEQWEAETRDPVWDSFNMTAKRNPPLVLTHALLTGMCQVSGKHLHDRCGSVHEQRGCAVFPRQILWDLAPLLRRRVGSLGSVPQSPDSVVANMWLGRVSAFVQQQVPRPRVFLTVAVAESLLPRGVSSEGRLEIQVYQLVDHVGVIF